MEGGDKMNIRKNIKVCDACVIYAISNDISDMKTGKGIESIKIKVPYSKQRFKFRSEVEKIISKLDETELKDVIIVSKSEPYMKEFEIVNE